MPLALLTLATAVAYAPGLPSSSTAGRWGVLALAVPAMTWIMAHRGGGMGHWCGVMLLAWSAATLMWSLSPWDTTGALLHLCLLAGVFSLAAGRDLRLAWLALCWGAAASLPFALAQHMRWPLVDALSWNAVGLFLTKNALAEVAALALVAALGLGRWWLASAALALIWMSDSREAWVMLAAAALWALWAVRLRMTALLLSAPLAAAALLWAWWTEAWRSAPVLERLDVWMDTTYNLRAQGWGLGAYAEAWPRYETAHNDLLQAAFELGLGSLLLLGVIWHALRGPLVLEGAMLAALLTSAMVWSPLQMPTTALVGALLLGRLCGARDDELCRQRALRAACPPSMEVANALRPGPL